MVDAAAEDVFRLAGTTLDGRFVVSLAIAEGGFGVVYRGEQAALDRPVALKVLKTPPDLSSTSLEQFLGAFANEAKTIARITHPNIVQVYDFGVSTMPSGDRAGWMALEWLTGVTLEQELAQRQGRGRSPVECLEVLRPVIAALATVHAAGVAHRDLKPANVMLVPTPTGRIPKLLDFGIAKIMDRDEEEAGTGHTATRSHQIAFSPAYAAPEQVAHGRTGPWTDVHALGLILTEMLIGHSPLTGKSSTALFQQILDRSRPTPKRFGVDVGAWEPVLTQALAVTPADRYKDASALLEALERTATDATSKYAVSAASNAPTSQAAPVSVTVLFADGHGPASNVTQMPESTTVRMAGHDRRARWILAGALAGVAAGGLLLVKSASWSAHPAASAAAASTGAPAESAGGVPRPPVTGEEPLPSAPTVPTATSASARSETHAHPVRSARPQAPASAPTPSPSTTTAPLPAPKPAVNCDPPFTVDSHGTKHYKPECDN